MACSERSREVDVASLLFVATLLLHEILPVVMTCNEDDDDDGDRSFVVKSYLR